MQLDIAAYGWHDAHWATMYPPGMPDEWCLDFFTNEFMAVVIPATVLAQQDNTTIQAWFDDAPARFRFYWELADRAGIERLLDWLQAHGRPAVLAGYLWRGEEDAEALLERLDAQLPGNHGERAVAVLAIEATPDLKAVRMQIQQWQQQAAEQTLIMVYPHPGAPASLQQLQTLGMLLNG